TRAAVRHRAVEPAVARLEKNVEHAFLGDRIADLDGAARDRLGLLGELDRREGRAVDAIASGAPSDDDDAIARTNLLLDRAARDDADASREDERIRRVALVEEEAAARRRNSHPIAIVAHAGDDAVKHAERMERARRDRVLRKIGRAETEDIRVDDRLGAEPGSERVAEHSSDAGARAAVWLDGRRVVVRLDLEGEPPRVIERDHSGVVAKDGEAEVAVGTKNQGL